MWVSDYLKERGAVIDLSFQDHQPDAQHLVFHSHNYGYCKAFGMINLAGSVTGGVIKPLCVDFNVHNVAFFKAHPTARGLELRCRTWTLCSSRLEYICEWSHFSWPFSLG